MDRTTDQLASQPAISVADFRRRITNLLARGPLVSVPRKDTDKLCLLLALSGAFAHNTEYDEPEVNAAIQRWLVDYDPEGAIDHVYLRRLLVDFGFLARSTDGQAYRLDGQGRGFAAFASEVHELDIAALVNEEREAAAARRAQFT